MEKIQLWFCDNIAVALSWQFYFLAFPLAGAWLYGKDRKKLAWILIGGWMTLQITVSAFTNLIFDCVLPD